MKLGFIGLGAMGRPMALHLHRAGHELAVWARRPEEKAKQAELVAGHVKGQDIVITTALIPGRPAPKLVSAEMVASMRPGSVLVDCSTIAPDAARHIAEKLGEKGIHFLDAPVSGGEQGAIDATLAIMAGGDAAVLDRVRPLLDCLGKRIVHIGPNGAGQVAKACNQMIMVAAIEAAAEGKRLAAAAGVDCAKVRQALSGGSAASRVLDVMGERMVRRDFSAGIEARLHHKDFGLVLEAARQSGVPVPLAAAVAQQLNALMAQGWGRDDTSSLLRVLELA